jgi:hypothetical protein
MVRILATGDWQASAKNLDRCWIALQFLKDYVKAHPVDAILLLGDLKESRNPVDQRVTNFLLELGKTCAQLAPTLAIAGNHDRILLDEDSQTGLPVLQSVGCEIAEEPRQFTGRKGLRVWAVPFYRDLAKAEAACLQGRVQGAQVLAFHNEVKGAFDSLKHTATTGLSPRVFDGYELAVGGHIHVHQQLAKRAWFAGPPFCQDWGEANQEKGLLLGRTGDGSVELVRLPLPTWYDPTLEGYKPATFKGVPVRIHLPAENIEQAKLAAQKKYPGAVFTFVPSPTANLDSDLQAASMKDEELVPHFVEVNGLWPQPHAVGSYLEWIMQDLGTGLRGLRGATFESATGDNVFCFEHVELALNRPGLTLVTGINQDWGEGRSNGAGKSSLTAIPLLAIAGRSLGGQRHDRWMRQGTTQTALASVSMRLADGRLLSIRRTRRPATLQVCLDGVDKTLGDHHATQRFIEEITGLTWPVLNSALYLGQTEVSTLMLGTDSQRKDLFSQLLGLQRFTLASGRLKEVLQRTQREREQILEMVAVREQEQREIQGYWAEANQQSARMALARAELKKLTTVAQTLQTQLLGYEGRWQSALKSVAPLEAATQQSRIQLALVQEKIRTLKQQIALGVTDRVCSLCKRPFPKGDTAPLEHLKGEMAKLVAEEYDTNKVFQERVADLRKKQSSQTALAENRLKAQMEERKVALRVAELQGQLQAAPDPGSWQKRLQEVTQLYEWARDAAEGLQEHIDFLEVCLQVVSRNGLPAYLCTLAKPQLNKATQEFSNIFAEAQIGVTFTDDHGELDVAIANLNGGENVEDQSAGELRLAAIIASLALRSVLAPYNYLCMDEPGNGLDPVNAAVFGKGLSAVAERFGTVLVVTHNPYILETLDYDYHLEVVKTNGVSVVVEK